jgi:nicotinamidase-related amidase
MENNIQRSALIVVDMQKVFINDQTKKVLERIKTFLTRKDRLFSCVIGTQYVNNKNTACYQYEGWKECMEGEEETEICPELINFMDYIVKKDKYTCYTEEFLKILKDNHINKVFFCGVNTGCCVLHSVLDCYENIIDCYVIEDLCGSTSGEHYHDISIDLLGTLITKERIVTSKGLD